MYAVATLDLTVQHETGSYGPGGLCGISSRISGDHHEYDSTADTSDTLEVRSPVGHRSRRYTSPTVRSPTKASGYAATSKSRRNQPHNPMKP